MEQKQYRIELLHAKSHEAPDGKKFEQGRSELTTNAGTAAYYRAQPEFVVTTIKPLKPVKAAVSPSKAPSRAPSKAPPPEEEEDDEEEDEDEESDDEDEEEEEDEDSEDDDEDEEEEAGGSYSKSTLASLTKPALVELGNAEFGLKLSEISQKNELIAAVLKAQIAKAKKG